VSNLVVVESEGKRSVPTRFKARISPVYEKKEECGEPSHWGRIPVI
jgi:hypothetical protein